MPSDNEMSSDDVIISRTPSSLNCFRYHDDYEVLRSFPFVVVVYPGSSESFTKSNAYEHFKGKIDMLHIINETILPLTVFCLKHLYELYIFNSSLRPSFSNDNADFIFLVEITYLESLLTRFVIVNTKVIQLPEEIGRLKRLSSLAMDNTDLIELPNAIGNLSSLEELFLLKNNLVSLPKTMANIKSLSLINLDQNSRLRSLEPLNGLLNLKNLIARDCSIDRLPSNLPNLEFLILSNNNLTDLIGIQTLGYSTNAYKTFDFSSNRINYIQTEIRFIRNLSHLNLSNNQLTFLPGDIFQLTSLTVLDISNNLFHTKELNTIVETFKNTHPYLELIY